MKGTCLFCKIRDICRHYVGIGQRVSNLGLPRNLSKDIHAFLRTNLPKHCGHYIGQPILEGDRDSLGRLFHRVPLKLWYPNQNIKTDACCHCGCEKSNHMQGIWCNITEQTMYQKEPEVREAPRYFRCRGLNKIEEEPTTDYRNPR